MYSLIRGRKKKIEQSGIDKGQIKKLMGVLIQWSEGRRELINYFTIVDKIKTSGQILAFEVSIQPYQSAQHDRIICKWCQCLLSGQNWN